MPPKQRRRLSTWADYLVAALKEGDLPNASVDQYIKSPMIFWSKSRRKEECYKLWLWDEQVGLSDFKIQVREAKTNFGADSSNWSEETKKTIKVMSVFNTAMASKHNLHLLPTEDLEYLENCGYGCKDIDLVQVTVEEGFHWALVFTNEDEQFFALDLSGDYGVTEKSHLSGLFELFKHSASKFSPQLTDQNFQVVFKKYFSMKNLIGPKTLLFLALSHISSATRVLNELFPILRTFLLQPHKSRPDAVRCCFSALQTLVNGTCKQTA